MEDQPVETTLYSLSDKAPEPSDRRDSDRHMTLFRVGSLTIGDRRELCLIKNISAGGMRFRSYCDIVEGTALSIELKSGHPVTGRASWVEGRNVGMTFDQAIDVVEILSTSMDGPRPRMPRIEVDCMATIRDGATVHELRVCDVSQGGIKAQGSAVIDPGADLSVSLPGLEPQAASVRWHEDGFLGIAFNRLLPLTDLVGWLQEQRDGVRAAG